PRKRRPWPAPPRLWPETAGTCRAHLKGFVAGQRGFFAARTRDHANATTAHSKITKTTASAVPNPYTAKLTKRSTAPKVRIHDQLRISGSRVHRFIFHGVRSSLGDRDAINGTWPVTG